MIIKHFNRLNFVFLETEIPFGCFHFFPEGISLQSTIAVEFSTDTQCLLEQVGITYTNLHQGKMNQILIVNDNKEYFRYFPR